MVFPMGKLISLIRSHIRHGQDGVRVGTPGASLGGLGPDCQCWAHSLNTSTQAWPQVNKICYTKTQVVVTIHYQEYR